MEDNVNRPEANKGAFLNSFLTTDNSIKFCNLHHFSQVKLP